MRAPRLLVSFVISTSWLGHPPPASAHRLDEYLQATRLSIEIDKVSLEIDLTAGVSVAPQVFAWIDTNRDGQISPVEGAAYAQQMLASVMLSVDGQPAPVTLVDSRFPDFRDMSLGVGMIRLAATAKLAPAASGRHQLSYTNTHRSGASVYLVNGLVPADPRIQIAGQRRDPAQHQLALDYDVLPDTVSARSSWVLAAFATIGILAMTRRPQTNARPTSIAPLPGGTA